jgi:hypothetical protein
MAARLGLDIWVTLTDMQKGTTINFEMYVTALQSFKSQIQWVQSEKKMEDVLLHDYM